MRELSIMVDESGEWGKLSKYYLITLVFHDQSEPVMPHKDYRLEQAADLMCTIELTALKFKAGENTETDHKMFGDWRSFKQNYLKALRRKQAK